MGNTSPDNIEFVDGPAPWRRVADSRTIANSIQNAITALRSSMNTGLGLRPTTTAMNNAIAAAKVPDTGWVNISAPSGYTKIGNTGVRKIGDQVVFRGGFSKTSGNVPTAGWNAFGTLDARFRPEATARAVVPGHSTPTGVNLLLTEVLAGGELRVASVGAGSDNVYLSGFSYMAKE